jgi:hypothetical protein
LSRFFIFQKKIGEKNKKKIKYQFFFSQEMKRRCEFDDTRRLQDEEYDMALQMELQKMEFLKMESLKISKKPKVLEAPQLLTNPNIRLKIRIFSGKTISCSFNEHESIQCIVKQLQWLFQSIECVRLFYDGKLLPMSYTLRQCGILDRTTIIADL